MRVIDFKVVVHGKVINPEEINYIDFRNQILSYYDKYTGDKEVKIDGDNVILLQNTGIKDTNGRYIYQQDIVEATDNSRYIGVRTTDKYEVRWNQDICQFYLYMFDGDFDNYNFDDFESFKILKNKYEE